MKDLCGLKRDEAGVIAGLSARGGMRRRLMDLGFTPGARVEYVLAAPGRGMRAYLIRGTLIALRESDAKTVLLQEARHA